MDDDMILDQKRQLIRDQRDELIREYEIVFNQYSHEDNITMIMGNLGVIVNFGLVAGFGYVLQASDRVAIEEDVLALAAVAITWFGILYCRAWKHMHISGKVHHDLRVHRARQIECELGWHESSFHLERVFYGRKTRPSFVHDCKPLAGSNQQYERFRMDPPKRPAFTYDLFVDFPRGIQWSWIVISVYAFARLLMVESVVGIATLPGWSRMVLVLMYVSIPYAVIRFRARTHEREAVSAETGS